MPDTRILVLTEAIDRTVLDALDHAGHAVTRAGSLAEVLEHAGSYDVVVLDIPGIEAASAACRTLRSGADAVATPVLCVAHSDTVEVRILVLEAGADDVIARPFDPRELDARVEALVLRLQRSKAIVAPGTDGSEPPGTPQLVAVFSPKGGAGTTTIAVNVAVLLARRVPDAVAIVDLDLQFGQVATHLNVPVRHDVVQLAVDSTVAADPAWLRNVAARHDSGLHVFGAAPRPEDADGLTVPQVEALLACAVGAYGTVLVDAGSTLDDRIRAVLARADAIVVVVTPEFPAVKAVNAFLEHVATTGADIGATMFVLNQVFARELLKTKDIEDTLGTKIALQIPYDPFLFLKAVNEGVPVALGAPRSPVAARFERLASLVVGSPISAAREPRRGGLAALLGRG